MFEVGCEGVRRKKEFLTIGLLLLVVIVVVAAAAAALDKVQHFRQT